MQQAKPFSLTMQVQSGAKALLQPGDFAFLGSYPFTADNQATYGRGLTCRRVGGQLRFLTFRYSGTWDGIHPAAQLIEFALPASMGQTISTKTGQWNDIWSPATIGPNVGGGDEYNIWHEDARSLLWATHCTDYPADPSPAGSPTGTNNPYCLSARTLNSNGTTGPVQGEWGFQGIGQRAIYGGMQPIPSWLSLTSPNPAKPLKYFVGWGGYTSRMAQGLVPSLGLMALAIPDPSTYPNGTIIPATDFLVLADHRSGATQSDYNPATGDRGQRNASVVNYYDSGDPRSNPSTPPTVPPAPGARWQSPAPDGVGRMVWGDHFAGGVIIDGSKQGLVCVANLAQGKAYYASSTLHSDSRNGELQIFDLTQQPSHPWNVQPAASKRIDPDLGPLGVFAHGNTGPVNGVGGMAFDVTSSVLYLWCPQTPWNTYGCLLAAYQYTGG